MHYFMDEGGNFIPAQGWAVICSLVLPHKSVGLARREINWISRDWPRKDGELKGGMLQPANLITLVDVLFRHDAILHASAIDMANEIPAGVEAHKVHQCEGITKYLTPAHHPDLVRDAWELRRILERMPNQLYIQYVLTSDMIRCAINESIMYFAQRRPRELAEFEWTIDAKDPNRVTPHEQWWLDTLGPLLESRSRREPFKL
jgi:hypothetical protein